tara:strand:- start:570 stop:725 length:156 start_codon:yes stop_codon:yes gene_type:complete
VGQGPNVFVEYVRYLSGLNIAQPWPIPLNFLSELSLRQYMLFSGSKYEATE